jgi:hypothetical protein
MHANGYHLWEQTNRLANHFRRSCASGAGVLFLLLALTGCASSERKAAEEIDFTPQIVQQASDLLAADRNLSRYHILVEGFKGDMRLKGTVHTELEKLRAEKIVWALRGVKSVDNELKVQ